VVDVVTTHPPPPTTERTRTMDIEQLVEIAEALPDAILERERKLEGLRQRLDWLESWSCNGTEYWRDRNHPTREPKLYINHGVDQACPMHGTPEPGKRLRIYLGANERRIEDARGWLENEKERKALEYKFNRLRNAMNRLNTQIRRLFAEIGYKIDDEGWLPPRPDPDWQPEKLRRW
jgi:hypothetical protein